MSSPFDLPFDDEPEPAPGVPAAPAVQPAPAAPAITNTFTGAPQMDAAIPPTARARQKPNPVEGATVAARRHVYSVSELTGRIRGLLESTFDDVWVEGELSNCRLWNTGHLYFTLKDGGAQIKGVMFRSALRALRFEPKDGLRILAKGRVSVYDPKGEYQLVCDQIEPEGLGALQLAFDQLKTRLAARGLFDAGRKRALPVLPRKVGIVTSLDGAAVRDIITVLRQRYPNAHLVIRPTRVQGEGSALEIARAIGAIGAVDGVDVVIIGRGGGSIEDLWAFNEEVVALAIAACPVPTISAVGHESDVTIADFVADVRAATPSNAAEIVVTRKDEFVNRIDRLAERLASGLTQRVRRFESRLRDLERRPSFAGVPGRIALRGRHASELTHGLRHMGQAMLDARRRRIERLRADLDTFDLRHRLGRVRAGLLKVDGRLSDAVVKRRFAAAARLGDAAARLQSLSPLAVLGRGYAVCWNADRTAIIRDAARVATGDTVQVTLSRGALTCDVRDRTYDPDDSGL